MTKKKNMLEARGVIIDIEKTKKTLEKMGAKFVQHYVFKDIIFLMEDEQYDLNKNLLRIRVYKKNGWPGKKVVLVKKHSEFKKIGKADVLLLRKEFDSIKEAKEFIKKKFNNKFKEGFSYWREGWQYDIDNDRFFIENIDKYKLSVEIESNDTKQLEFYLGKLKIKEIKNSMAEIMNKILLS